MVALIGSRACFAAERSSLRHETKTPYWIEKELAGQLIARVPCGGNRMNTSSRMNNFSVFTRCEPQARRDVE